MLAYERVPLSQPEMVRARALARARAALRETPATTQATRVAPTRVRRLLFAAAAGLTLMAGAAAAFQVMRRPPTPTNAGTPPVTHRPMVVPPPAGPAFAPMTPGEPEPTNATSAASRVPSSLKAPGPRTLPAAKHDSSGEELQLLSRARESDARGDYAEVLAPVAEHERSHPAGRLAEEREVLRVKALVGLGRGSEARQAATKFRRQFPRSVLLPKVEEMLASLK